MAIAEVGTRVAGTLTSGGAANTPSWGTGQTRAAGNKLICWAAGFSGSVTPTPPTPSGWTLEEGLTSGLQAGTAVFSKVATGGDAAPTFPATTGTAWAAQVSEFSGVGATDKVASHQSLTNPNTATAPSADVASGQLICYAMGIRGGSGTRTHTASLNNGATAVDSNNGIVAGNEFNFGSGITTSNSVADAATLTFGATSPNGTVVVLASFKAATGTTFSDTPSGALIIGGTDTESLTRADSRSGAVILGGSVVEHKTMAASPTGAVILAGTLSSHLTHSGVRSGALVIGGSLSTHLTRSITPSGALVLGGALSTHLTRSITPSGVLILGGSLTSHLTRSDSRSGALILSGSLVESLRRSDSVAGAVILGGSVSESFGTSFAHSDAPTGHLILAGTLLEALRHAAHPSGAVVLGGSIQRSYARASAPHGTLILGGSMLEVVTSPNSLLILRVALSDDAPTFVALADDLPYSLELSDGPLVLVTLTDD